MSQMQQRCKIRPLEKVQSTQPSMFGNLNDNSENKAIVIN